MSQIKAEIVAHSIRVGTKENHEIISYLLTYPRIIHAELLTHRLFSRNASSSRAIPFKKMVESVKKTPFIPIAIQKDHKGMQGTEYFEGKALVFRRWLWLTCRTIVCFLATILHKFGYTKQLANRILEPFQMYTSLVTATEFENFFKLRSPQYQMDSSDGSTYFKSKLDLKRFWTGQGGESLDDLSEISWLKGNKGMAELHLMALAEAMWDAYQVSTPRVLEPGEWHIPYESKIEAMYKIDQYHNFKPVPDIVKVASMMAARTSYTVVGTDLADWTVEKYCKKSDELAMADPLHASPFEHCSQSMTDEQYEESAITYPKGGISYGWCRNYRGFIQFRAILEQPEVYN